MDYLPFFLSIILTLPDTKDEPLPSLYGVTITKPIGIPECKADPKMVAKFRKDKLRFSVLPPHFPYEINRTAVCYKRDDKHAVSDTAIDHETLRIDFPIGAQPKDAAWGSVYATIIHGMVQSIGFSTAGLDDQRSVLAHLSDKLGRPSSLDTVEKQNGYGAKFQAIRATWSFSTDVIAYFEGFGSRTDYGTFWIKTKAGRDEEAELLKTLTSGTPL